MRTEETDCAVETETRIREEYPMKLNKIEGETSDVTIERIVKVSFSMPGGAQTDTQILDLMRDELDREIQRRRDKSEY